MKKILLICTVISIGLAAASQPLQITPKDLDKLASMMTGSFSSEKQSIDDKDYLHISLGMTPILTGHTDGYWLYVEQAMASTPDKPYRQRVYHLYQQDDSTIVSKVYELKNPQQYTGGNINPAILTPIAQDSLVDRQGCSIYLHKTGKKTFEGSTPGKECLSSMKGATYATSEVIITPKMMVSWDRGWNREDKQVWGAEKGGYIFIKQ